MAESSNGSTQETDRRDEEAEILASSKTLLEKVYKANYKQAIVLYIVDIIYELHIMLFDNNSEQMIDLCKHFSECNLKQVTSKHKIERNCN